MSRDIEIRDQRSEVGDQKKTEIRTTEVRASGKIHGIEQKAWGIGKNAKRA
jgi:hypothetical protein